MSDETTDSIYLNLQVVNTNNSTWSTINATIDQKTNEIVHNLSDYNLYLSSLMVSTAELPYFNIKRNILDFTTNQTNMTISFIANDPAIYPFALGALPINYPLFQLGNTDGAGNYQGCGCYITYLSENANTFSYPNPGDIGFITSENYPRSYFNVHSIGQVMNMINIAIENITANWISAIVPANKTCYFYYDSLTQLYSLEISNELYITFNTGTLADQSSLYINSYLERLLDGFRWKYYINTNFNGNMNTQLSYKFIPYNTLNNYDPILDIWTYSAEYPTIANLLDAHSLIVVTSNSLNNIRQEYIPTNQNNNGTLPSLSCLKNLDFNFNELQFNSINNCVVQYTANTLDRPIHTTGSNPLTALYLQFFIQTIDQSIYPITIPPNGMGSIKFCLKKKKKDNK